MAAIVGLVPFEHPRLACFRVYTLARKPVGLDHLYDTLTQSSHVFPSVLASETDRVTGNTGVTKSSFVNQTFDRGSEDQIMKEAAKLKEPVFVGVEILE